MSPAKRSPAQIAVAVLAAIDAAAIVGLVWFAAKMLGDESVMVVEVSVCAGLAAVLAGLIWGGMALHRRGRTGAAIAVLAVGAVPTLAVIGFLLYLEANPIDWR